MFLLGRCLLATLRRQNTRVLRCEAESEIFKMYTMYNVKCTNQIPSPHKCVCVCVTSGLVHWMQNSVRHPWSSSPRHVSLFFLASVFILFVCHYHTISMCLHSLEVSPATFSRQPSGSRLFQCILRVVKLRKPAASTTSFPLSIMASQERLG